MGYGLVVFIVLICYYAFSLFVLHKAKEKRWTIVWEVGDIFVSVLISIFATYLYASWVLGFQFEWMDGIFFLLNAASVALLPVLIYLGFIYFKWRDVLRSTLQTESIQEEADKVITLTGANKSDHIQTHLSHVLYLRAQDNYVLLHLEQEDKIQRHMIRSTLTQMIDQLNDPRFLKVHRSYVVNIEKIESFSGNKSKSSLKIKGVKTAIPVARSNFDQVKKMV